MNKDEHSDHLSHKDLLYSEILNTSVTSHVHELFKNRQESCTTHPIQRSSVLARASKFLKSVDKVDENVQSIEDVEDGQPVIDMDVTLIQRGDDSENDSELGLNDEDSDNETEDDELISSDSDKETSEYKSVDSSLHFKSVNKMFGADSELFQNRCKDVLLKINCISKNKTPESDQQEDMPLNQQLILSTDSDCVKPDSCGDTESLFTPSDSCNEQFENENKEIAMNLVNSNRLSEQESVTQDKNILEFPETNFRFLNYNISNSSCKHDSTLQSLEDLKCRKRKLIAVIEDDDSSNLCQTKTQKVV